MYSRPEELDVRNFNLRLNARRIRGTYFAGLNALISNHAWVICEMSEGILATEQKWTFGAHFCLSPTSFDL